MSERRSYSDAERATALAALEANGGNIGRTSRELGLPRATLQNWSRREAAPDLGHQKRGELAEALADVAWRLAGAIPSKLDAANLQQVAVSLGIVIDKMQLLKGMPTAITEDASLSDEERANRVAALLERARARRVGQAAAAAESAVDAAAGAAD